MFKIKIRFLLTIVITLNFLMAPLQYIKEGLSIPKNIKEGLNLPKM